MCCCMYIVCMYGHCTQQFNIQICSMYMHSGLDRDGFRILYICIPVRSIAENTVTKHTRAYAHREKNITSYMHRRLYTRDLHSKFRRSAAVAAIVGFMWVCVCVGGMGISCLRWLYSTMSICIRGCICGSYIYVCIRVCVCFIPKIIYAAMRCGRSSLKHIQKG